jgi:hypothetical protein
VGEKAHRESLMSETGRLALMGDSESEMILTGEAAFYISCFKRQILKYNYGRLKAGEDNARNMPSHFA